MQKDIHPVFNYNCKVTCSCGATHEIGSTLPELKVEICSQCHPFYTGKQKLVDTEGRVDKFKKRQSTASVTVKKKEEPKEEANTEKEEVAETPEQPKEEATETNEAPSEEAKEEAPAEEVKEEEKEEAAAEESKEEEAPAEEETEKTE